MLKPTGFLTNSAHIARALNTTCPRDHDHVNLIGGRAASLYVQNGIESAVDDVSGAVLDAEMVRAGREVEMNFFKTMGVYDRVPRSEQLETGGKIIGTKWIDVNKGDFDNPKIRSCLVGK